MEPRQFTYPAMGCIWAITLWDTMSDAAYDELQKTIIERSTAFEETFSRFKASSLIRTLAETTGTVAVPRDLTTMLRFYERLYDLTDGIFTPLLGFTISDMGYDEQYSLTPKDTIRPVPALHDTLEIVDDEHITLHQKVLMDLGGMGKGYFVDVIADFLDERGVSRYLVNGSGDIRYRGHGTPIRAGLEHPGDATKAIGVIEIENGALCASAGNRRKWATYQHTINPKTLTSPEEILATWVLTERAALADGLATCFFMVDPDPLQRELSFEYCLLNKEYRVKKSDGFEAEFF